MCILSNILLKLIVSVIYINFVLDTHCFHEKFETYILTVYMPKLKVCSEHYFRGMSIILSYQLILSNHSLNTLILVTKPNYIS